MESRTVKTGFVALGVWLATGLFGPLLAQDVEGSQDHPVTGRYEGSEIKGYSNREFDVYKVWTGQQETLEGQVSEISYLLPDGVSDVAAHRNFTKRLEEQGYEALFDCNAKIAPKDCSYDLAYGISRLPTPKMLTDTFNYSYSLFRSPGAGNIYVALLSSTYSGKVMLQASIIEIEAMEFKMVDAAQISDELSASGHIALYGIRFDTDSATLKPESIETLIELAKVLLAQPDRQIMIVGHTDNQGTLEYNIDLSTRRAQSVREFLAGQKNIPAELMRAHGVGFLAPVASNQTADGRGLNRRVEIVAR